MRFVDVGHFCFSCFLFVWFSTGDQHEYCKSDNSDAIQATENTSARENTFQTQQDSSDNSRLANRTKSNRPTGYRDRPSTSIINQQVSKQNICTGNLSPGEAKQQASSPSPETTISLGSSTSTAIRAEPNSFGHNNNNNSKSNYHGHITVDNNSTSKRSPVTGERPITGAFSAVTAPLTSAKLESNNNNRNISDM